MNVIFDVQFEEKRGAKYLKRALWGKIAVFPEPPHDLSVFKYQIGVSSHSLWDKTWRKDVLFSPP